MTDAKAIKGQVIKAFTEVIVKVAEDDLAGLRSSVGRAIMLYGKWTAILKQQEHASSDGVDYDQDDD